MNVMLAIKNKISATPALAGLVGRTFAGVVGERFNVTDSPNGPYCRLVHVGYPDQWDYGFNDGNGTGFADIQFSVYAATLNAAETLVDSIIATFHNCQMQLSTGNVAYGLKRQRGWLAEPNKAPDSTQVFSSWTVIRFSFDGE